MQYIAYQDAPEDEPYNICPKCGEQVYIGRMDRHMAKDHDPVEELAWHYNISIETIEQLVYGG